MDKKQLMKEYMRMEDIVSDRRSTPQQVQDAIKYVDSFGDKQASWAIRFVAGEVHGSHHLK